MADNFDDLLKQLGEVKPGMPVTRVASSTRMNAITQLIKMLVMGENIMEGPNIRKDTSAGRIILSGAKGVQPKGGGIGQYPFRVTAGTKDNYTAIRIYPGKILNQVPYVDGFPLNVPIADSFGNLNYPSLTPPSTNFSVWLIVRIANLFDNYHPRIDIAEPGETGYVPVKPPDESCYLTTVAPDEADQIDFRVKWDTPGNKEAGGFPIRIADVTVEAPGPGVTTGPVVKSITQYVFNNWRSLILSDNDIIPISY